MRKILFVLLLIAAFATPAVSKELTLGHTGQPMVTFSKVADLFGELVGKYSDGKMTVSVMGASALGNNREGIEQVQSGVTDFWIISTGLLAPFSKAVSVYDLPYIFKSEEAALGFIRSPGAFEIVAPLEEKGIKALGYILMGWRHIHSNIPVRKPEDVKGIKIRTEPAPIRMAIFTSMGGNAIPMDFGEVFVSLQQGIIDAGENSMENIKSQGFNEVQKYITMDGHILDPMLLVISKATWDKLSDEERAVIQKAANEACVWGQDNVLESNKKVYEGFKAAGAPEIIELSPEERAAFREATKAVYDKYMSEVGEENYKKIQEFQKDMPEGAPRS